MFSKKQEPKKERESASAKSSAQERESAKRKKSTSPALPFLCDMSCGYTCPLVPAVDRQAFLQAGNILVHPGIRATQRLLTACFVWRGMKIVMTSWCRDYQLVQGLPAVPEGKVHKQPAYPLQATPISARRPHAWDLVGPLLASPHGHIYLLICIHRSSRWLEMRPLKNMEASHV